jgi:hypothetical protein
MKLGMMQPYFFPYAGYISVVKHANLFILCDEVQFMRQGWIERNRILKQDGGWVYIKVPLVNKGLIPIKDIRVDNRQDWKQKILAQVKHYEKCAPYYTEITKMLKELFTKDFEDIVSLNKETLLMVCKYLNIQTEIKVFSEMGIEIEKPKAADEWALNTCKALGNITEYWNPPSGKHFYDKSKYEKANISLNFLKINMKPYPQNGKAFEEGLSIIDVMMFNSAGRINEMLDDYKLI